jgi:hypothetical protein
MPKTTFLFLLMLSEAMTFEARGQAPAAVEEAAVPDEQKEFCSIVEQYRDTQTRYSQESNPIQKAERTPPNPLRYEEHVKELFSPHNEFRNWVGTLRFSVVGKSISLVFLPECGSTQQFIQFSNATPMPSGLNTGMQPEDVGTIIHMDSPLADTLREARGANQRAKVSGNLVPYSALSRLGNALNTNRYAIARTYFKSRAGGTGASVALPNHLANSPTLSCYRQRSRTHQAIRNAKESS